MAKAKQMKVRVVKGVIGQKPDNGAKVRSLGLKKINSSKIHKDNDAIRGMIANVSHLVKVEEM